MNREHVAQGAKTKIKVKYLSLAAEVRIIRNEERKLAGDHPLRHSLEQHRKYCVSATARDVHLAYGFLRGRKYREIENSVRESDSPYKQGESRYNYPDWDAVFREINTFANPTYRPGDPGTAHRMAMLQQAFKLWKDEAKLDEPGHVTKVLRTKIPWDGTPRKKRRLRFSRKHLTKPGVMSVVKAG